MTDVAALPKAELHVHLEGTLEPELAFKLAARNQVALPWPQAAAVRDLMRFDDLQGFLDLYYACQAVLLTAEDFQEVAAAYLARARADGVTRVEMFFDPQEHTARGVPLGDVVRGLVRAGRDSAADGGPELALIPCVVRHRGPADALATVEALEPHRHDLLALGMDSTEIGWPPGRFRPAFEAARAMGLHTVAHAGEEGPPAFVWEALDVLGVERVDHGATSVRDPALVRRLAADRIPLTMCPLSNARLGVVPSLADHPLPRLLDAGVPVTVNSDDPAYFGGYVADNYRALAEVFGFGEAELRELAGLSLAACFTG
jgi:adenosine deaminase